MPRPFFISILTPNRRLPVIDGPSGLVNLSSHLRTGKTARGSMKPWQRTRNQVKARTTPVQVRRELVQ